jgi:hypothetical protein
MIVFIAIFGIIGAALREGLEAGFVGALIGLTVGVVMSCVFYFGAVVPIRRLVHGLGLSRPQLPARRLFIAWVVAFAGLVLFLISDFGAMWLTGFINRSW